MTQAILKSHVQKDSYRKEALFSVLGHAALLLFFLFGIELFPAGAPLLIGTGAGGGKGGDFVSVGLSAEVGGGAGMYKPALTPKPQAVVSEPKKEEAPLPRPDETIFLEKGKSQRKRADAVEKTAAPVSKTEAPEPTARPGLVPTTPQPGSGGAGGGSPGSGGGFGGGQGVSIGSGSGEGVVDSWYARQVEQRIGSNWLKSSLGPLGRRVQTILSFEIRPNGALENIQLEQTSGIRSVDLAAERAVRASHPLPPLPSELRGRRVKFIAHFEYPPR